MASFNPRITKGYDPVTKQIETGLPSVDDVTVGSGYYNNLLGVKFNEELQPIGYEIKKVAVLPSGIITDDGKVPVAHVVGKETRYELVTMPQVYKVDLKVTKTGNTITSIINDFYPTFHTITPQELFTIMEEFEADGQSFKIAFANLITMDGADFVSCEAVPINYSVTKDSFFINYGNTTIYGDIANNVWTLTDPSV